MASMTFDSIAFDAGASFSARERVDRAFRTFSIVVVAIAALGVIGTKIGTPSAPQLEVVTAQGAPAELSREWVWKRSAASFDAMFPTLR
jgi:hypothetical protein